MADLSTNKLTAGARTSLKLDFLFVFRLDRASMDPSDDYPAKQRPAPHIFQRTITLSACPGHVDGRVEDNVHDFGVAIGHDNVRVQAVLGSAYRVPWTSCPFAVPALNALVGVPLAGGGPRIDQGQQCTHLFDLARLAIAQASRGGARRYDISIAAEAAVGVSQAQLWRDGDLILDWLLQEDVVIVGDRFVGHKTSGRAIWPAEIETYPDLIEAALILRRCMLVFRERRRVTADVQRASELGHMAGACFSFQPERAATAIRPRGFNDYLHAPIQGRLYAPAAGASDASSGTSSPHD